MNTHESDRPPGSRSDDELLALLRTLPAPALSPAAADRILQTVQTAARNRPSRSASALADRLIALGGALAATIVLTLAVTLPDTTPTSIVTKEPVRLLLQSERALNDVTIEIELPEGVRVRGYGDQRRLSWQSSLLAGPNVLELPIVVEGAGGVLVARVTQGDEARELAVRLVAAQYAEDSKTSMDEHSDV
ncbi:MAG: hypothetical protein RL756_1410 [Pseudomonadota bacterium]|jgi:hypothetical protein